MQQTVLQRIREIIDYLSISDRKFAELIGVPQTTLSSLFQRGNEPNVSVVQSVLDRIPNISMEWLLFGRGEMLILKRGEYLKKVRERLCLSIKELSDVLGVKEEYYVRIENGEIPLKEEYKNIINSRYNIDSRDLPIEKNARQLLSENISTSVVKINNDEKGIPYYADLPVSAGQLDTFMQDAEPTGWVNLPGVTSKALFPVIGCSMKPEINPGDVVGIVQMNSWEIVDPDKTYLIITHDERMIKHLAIDEEDNTILWCISPNYPKFKINKSDIKFLYRISFCGKLI